MNTLVVGMTQSGKSTAELKRLTEWKGAAVILDPHNSLAKKYIEILACRNNLKNVAYDDLSRTDKVLSWTFIERSRAKSVADQLKQNDDRGRQFADILCRRRGLSIHSTPLIEEWAMAAIKLWLYQRKPKRLLDIVYAFRPKHPSGKPHPKFAALIQDCEIQDLSDRFEQLKYMTPQTLVGTISPAQRLFEGTILSPAFMLRCSGGFDYRKLLDAGGKIIIGGDRENRNTTRVILSAIAQVVMQYVRSGGKPVRLVVDEASNYDLIGLPEKESLAEDQKLGLDWDILVQSANFGSQEITDGVLLNTGRHEFFRCAGETAETGAKDIGIALLDAKATKAQEKRTRQVHDGYDYENVESKSIKGVGWKPDLTQQTRSTSQQARARYRTVEDVINVYKSYDEQIKDVQKDLMGQETGWRWVREGKKVWKEYVEKVQGHPWERVAQKRGQEATEVLIGAYGITPSLPSLKRTRSPSPKASSSGSSAATKLLGPDSTDSKEGNEGRKPVW